MQHLKITCLRAAVLVFCLAHSLSVWSQADTTKSELSINGYVDAYYLYNLNRPASLVNQARVFDLAHNSFSLGLVQTVLSYKKGKSNFVADIAFGPNADLANFGNTGTSLVIKQAYFSYQFTQRLKMTVGQFGTHIGYELIDAPLNANYSLSYLFGNGPFYATGIKFDYALSDKVAFMAGVVNGWDAIKDFNAAKSLVAQLSLVPVEGMNLYLNWKGGDESNGMSGFGKHTGSYTSIFDVTGTYQLSEKLKLGLNTAYGSFKTGATEAADDDPHSKDGTWYGAALYFNYTLSEKLQLALRGEHFDDSAGLRYFGAIKANALTLTGTFSPMENLKIKPELRFDAAESDYFVNADGQASKTQTTLGIAFVYNY